MQNKVQFVNTFPVSTNIKGMDYGRMLGNGTVISGTSIGSLLCLFQMVGLCLLDSSFRHRHCSWSKRNTCERVHFKDGTIIFGAELQPGFGRTIDYLDSHWCVAGSKFQMGSGVS